MSAGQFRLPSDTSRTRVILPSKKFVAISHLRKLRGSEQVAAVCYRMRGGMVEFLLVRTRSGRWIFPKGSAEPGLTHAQAAALEAFEEAGVHGRIEEAPFTRYTRRKGTRDPEITVHAHLCEVLWLDRPQEFDRDPTWFSAERAKRRLIDDRGTRYGRELEQVIDRAAMRIRRAHGGTDTLVDSIRKVRLMDDVAVKQTRRFRFS
jgi:8-oxo-dGTP pyrophosphatase MutT (NUDIX family)